ncbi:hypothetical protein STCU_08616 [Strigomonas culicis]|uniref:Uncharacterized protein n=1 Tax=Strigomonas culicis TaxID=28005 RepID=S9TXG2_9TRYP|nr:hypothetical protein STCU_08616 [Strigomonas culicis]|eukprot:EPY21284.1 hypothetical protein STCU_08616 [Strigomonas culicis]
MYMRVGVVWRRNRCRPPSMERQDLVMQLAPQSPYHSKVSVTDMHLHLNASFIDRQLWKSLSNNNALPSAVVTGVSYGGIGFYTALHLLLSGVNVHGVVRSDTQLRQVAHMMQVAVDRQCVLHKEWMGKIGRIMLHLCDLSDTAAVSRLADTILTDPNLRIVVCSAGPMCTPVGLSPQGLEEQFATHYVGHSLLLLRLLAHRRASNVPVRTLPPWRIVLLSSGTAATAAPNDFTTFHQWPDAAQAATFSSPFSGYNNAKMCELLFGLALSRVVRTERRLATCTVCMLHPGPTRSRALANSGLPLQKWLHGEAAALLCVSPVIAALFVVDLALSKRHEQANGHFFRMGEDQTVYHQKMIHHPETRKGFFRNSTLFPGIPGPEVALSIGNQNWLWRATIRYFVENKLIDASSLN